MAAMQNLSFSNPKEIAELGEKIYLERHKEEYERDHRGRFVAIDVKTGNPYLGDTPEVALEQARAAAPDGIFHLIQVGFPGAFRVSHTSNKPLDWIFR